MKLKLLALMIGILMTSGIEAQELYENSKTMNMGTHNGFYIELEGAEKNNVEKLWKDYLKDYSKKVKKKKNEFYTENGRIPIVNGSAELTLYSKLDEGRNMTTLYTWIDLGGAFMNSEDHPSQVEGFTQFMEDFFFIVKKDVIKRELEDGEDILKDLDKDLDKLVGKNKDLHDEIAKAQEKIRKAEEEIMQNLALQEEKRAEIDQQMKKLEEIISRLNSVGKS